MQTIRVNRNQALAHLYQAEAAIFQAGIKAEASHGASEEGDPWVAFVEPCTGDVIAHVAVIDGDVIADTPAFARPLRTRDMSMLLDQLVRGLR